MGLHFPSEKEVFTIRINDFQVSRRVNRGVTVSGADVEITQRSIKSVEIVGTNQAFEQVFLAMDKLKSKKSRNKNF